MPRRRLPCDVPECPHQRAKRWHRLCPAHGEALGVPMCRALRRAFAHDKSEWRRLRRGLASGATPCAAPSPQPAADPAAVYSRTAAMLGEHD